MILNSQGISHLSRANHKRGIKIKIRTSHITIRLNHFRNSDILAKNNSKNAKNSVKFGNGRQKGVQKGRSKLPLVEPWSMVVLGHKGWNLMKLGFWADFWPKSEFKPTRISGRNISVWGIFGSRSSVWRFISSLWYVAVYQVLKLLSDLMRMTFLKIVMNHYPTRHHEFITC